MAVYCDYDNDSNANANDEPEPKCDNNSNASNSPRSNNNVLFDSKDNRSNNSTADKDIDKYYYLDSNYNSNRIDITMTEDIDKCYITKLNKSREPL